MYFHFIPPIFFVIFLQTKRTKRTKKRTKKKTKRTKLFKIILFLFDLPKNFLYLCVNTH